jgi:hypothetical protein
MSLNMLLYITFLIYIITMTLGFIFKAKWVFMIAGILWFIPLIEIDNVFLKLISITLMITHFAMGLVGKEGDDFE